MNENEKSLKQKLLDLKNLVCIMQKDSKGHNYTYVSEESILLAINDKMLELGLKLTPKFVPGTLHSEVLKYQNKQGNEVADIIVRSEMIFEWEDIYTGEIESINWAMIGQQGDASQALGSGLTYANRYFLLKYFNIATSNDDPDKIKSELKAKEEEAKAKNKISSDQTKIKKLFEKAIKVEQTKENVYKKLGTTKEQFLKDYADEAKAKALLEQLEAIYKGD